MTPTTLSGRVALVTGGGRGIGKAISLALADAGCDVAVNYVSREADARATVDAITTKGRRALAAAGDVSKSADVTALVAAVETGLGPVDILVNNAGRVAFESIDQMSEASWNEIIQVNLSSVFLMTQAVLPGMRARKWGRIINLTSVAAQAGSMMAVHYSAAKAGVIAATKSYARMLAKEGFTVKCGDVAVLLAGNAYITGQTIGVNGGMYLGS